MADALTMRLPEGWTGGDAPVISVYWPDSEETTVSDTSGSAETGDFGAFLLKDLFRILDASKTYKQELAVRSKFVSHAPLLANAAMKRVGTLRTPDHVAVIEDVVIHGVDLPDGLRALNEALLANRITEICSWSSIIAGYLQAGRAVGDRDQIILVSMLVRLARHASAEIRIEAVSALERIAESYPEAQNELRRIAAEDSNSAVASEALQALQSL